MTMRIATGFAGALGLILAGASHADPTVYTSLLDFVAAHPGATSADFDALTSSDTSQTAGGATFSGPCANDTSCLLSYGNGRLFVDQGGLIRHCANEIPDTASRQFEVCVRDHNLLTDPGDSGGSYVTAAVRAELNVQAAGSSFGLLLGGFGQSSLAYTVNGVSGTLAIPRVAGGVPTFIGFSADAPIVLSLRSSAGPIELFGYAQSAPAVPEPAGWAMMILGFGLIGAAARRRTGDRVQAV